MWSFRFWLLFYRIRRALRRDRNEFGGKVRRSSLLNGTTAVSITGGVPPTDSTEIIEEGTFSLLAGRCPQCHHMTYDTFSPYDHPCGCLCER
jgi:hypothetical protein